MPHDRPLAGVRAIEMAGAGPSPYCATLLADLGATVLRIAPLPGAGKGIGVVWSQELSPDLRSR